MSYLLWCIEATNTAPTQYSRVCHLSDRVSHLAGNNACMVHVVTCLHIRNVHSLKPACRMVKLLWHDVLVLSASCKRSINVAIGHDRLGILP